jgi:Tfp pilus assembly protein PilO
MKKINITIYSLLGIFLVALLFFLFSLSYFSIKTISQTTLQTRFNELNTRKDELLGLKKSHEEWQHIEDEYKSFTAQYCINYSNFVNFRKTLDQKILQNGLEASRFQTNRRDIIKGLEKMTYNFSVTGDYKNLKKFLYEVETLDQMIFLTDLELSRTRHGIKGSLSLEVYFAK